MIITFGLRGTTIPNMVSESLSGRSISQSTEHLTREDSVQVFQLLCRELTMSPTFVDYALSELLGAEF